MELVHIARIKRILENNCYELPLNEPNTGGVNAKFN
jgi:hypothetical protein